MLTSPPWSHAQWQSLERTYQSNHTPLAFILKRIIDIGLASIGLILLLPLLVLLAIAVYFSSPGPILFVQQRLGKRGRPFPIYKFRTMVDGAIHLGTGLDTFADDPRITPIGRWLREYHLDELPQLCNILRGEMSLVGPRPLLPESWAACDEGQKMRFLVRPGLTALEAVEGGLDNDWEERMRLDVWYVNHWSLWLDGVILLRTIPVVLRKQGVYAQPHTCPPSRREQA